MKKLHDRILMQKFCPQNILLPRYEIQVDDSLGFSISVYGWLLPETHDIYKCLKRSVKNVNIIDLVGNIESHEICDGIGKYTISNGEIVNHCVPKLYDPLLEDYCAFPCNQFNRHIHCELLSNGNKCISCTNCFKLSQNSDKRKSRMLSVPAKKKAPISLTSHSTSN